MYDSKYQEYVIGISPDLKAGEGEITSVVPINNKPPKVDRKPDFKTIFKNQMMHDPNQHRRYFVTPTELGQTTELLNKTREKYNRPKLELQSVHKDGKQYLTLSQKTIDYLKQKDMEFVKSTITNQWHRDENYNAWQHRLGSVNDSGTKRLENAYRLFKSQYDETQQNFKDFVADFTRSLIELEQPLQYKFIDKTGKEREVGVGTGNYYAGDIDEMINAIFGNVTDDDFIEAVNEERYNQKKETTCCLLVCIENKIYRGQGIDYKDSPDYVKDVKEFEEYKKTNDYIPYSPPPSYTEVKVGSFMDYVRKVNSAYRSPFNFFADTVKPYLNMAESEYDFFSYSIKGNEINLNFDFTL